MSLTETRDGFSPLLSVEEGTDETPTGAKGTDGTKGDKSMTPEEFNAQLGLFKPEALGQLEEMVKARIVKEGGQPASRTWDSLLGLAVMWIKARTKKHIEIWIFSCFFFYVDFGLDLRMMWTFYHFGDKYFILFTCIGIGAGVIYTLAEFIRNVKHSDPTWMILLCGFLLPFQLHVLFLCFYSATYDDRRGHAHPLLHCFKLAESALEATMSALIQSYAMIFRHLEHWDYMFTFLSCSSSYASIAYCFCMIDRRDTGLQRLPGVSVGWCPKLACVFLFRMCEVLSRLISVALFQLAVRNEKIFMDYGLQNTGGACVVFVDWIIMLILTAAFQGIMKTTEHKNWFNCVYSFLSAIVYINPLLLKENAFSIPCWVYYSVRVIELSGMGFVAWKSEVFHGGGHGKMKHRDFFDHNATDNFIQVEGFEKEFYDDHIVLYAFAVATVLMCILLPIIRYFSTNVLLEDKDMFTATKFGPALVFLCDELMLVEGKEGAALEDCKKFHRDCKGIVDLATSRLRASINDTKKTRGKRQHKEAGAGADTLEQEGRTGWVTTYLEKWLDRQYESAMESWSASRSTSELFEELVRAGNNLHHWLKGDAGFFYVPSENESDRVNARYELQATYLKYLEVLSEVLNPARDDSESIVAVLDDGKVVRMILKSLPGWSFAASDQRLREQELLLFQERCQIISRLSEIGWQNQGRNFHGLAVELRDAFDVHSTKDDIKAAGIKDNKASNVDPFDWIVRVQMGALVAMYNAIPRKIRKNLHNTEILNNPKSGLFRKDKEIEAVMNAATVCMDQRGQEAPGIVDISELIKDSERREVDVMVTVNLLKASFSGDDMHYSPAWDKKWEANRALGIMTTTGTHLRLLNVVKRLDGVEEVVEIAQPSDLDALLPAPTDGEENSGIFSMKGVVLKFNFRRMIEMEDQPLERLKKHGEKGWHIHETAMLSLFTALSMDVMKQLCGNDERVQNFIKYSDRVASDAKAALERKLELLRKEGENFVDPKTAISPPGLVQFKKEHDAGKQWGIKEMSDLKHKSNAKLQEYEKITDTMKEFLNHAESKYSWNNDVKAHIKTNRQSVKHTVDKQRHAVSGYWARMEGLVTAAAKQQEARANAAAQEAAEREAHALQKEKEAEETAAKREEDARRAEEQAQSAEEKARTERERADAQIAKAEAQKQIAESARAKAEKARQEALEERDSARSELQISDEMMRRAESDKLEAKQAAERAELEKKQAAEASTQARKAETEAREREEIAHKQEKIAQNTMRLLEEREAQVREACEKAKAEGGADDAGVMQNFISKVAGIVGN